MSASPACLDHRLFNVSLTAHIVIEDCKVSTANELLEKINKLLEERFHIEHTNIQFECLLKK